MPANGRRDLIRSLKVKIYKNTDAPCSRREGMSGGEGEQSYTCTRGQHQAPAALTLGRTVPNDWKIGCTPQSVWTDRRRGKYLVSTWKRTSDHPALAYSLHRQSYTCSFLHDINLYTKFEFQNNMQGFCL